MSDHHKYTKREQGRWIVEDVEQKRIETEDNFTIALAIAFVLFGFYLLGNIADWCAGLG